MQSIRRHPAAHYTERKPLLVGLLVMLGALVAGGFLLLLAEGTFDEYLYVFLLPWILGLGIVLCLPTLILLYRGEFSLAHPIAFATWSYLFPAFVIGGICLAAGWTDPYYIAFIQDPRDALPFSLVLVGIGFTGLCVGYFLPAGAWLGVRLQKVNPFAATLSEEKMLVPGLALFALGIGTTVFAFLTGIGGYQPVETSSYNGLVYLTTLFWVEGSFLLWSIIFRSGERIPARWLVIGALVSTALVKAAFAGARGALLNVAITCGLAYVLSRSSLKLRQYAVGAAICVVIIMIGMIYGSVFRSLKGGEDRETFARYAATVTDTFDEISREDPQEIVGFAFSRVTERIDILSSLAVVVSNYERLRPLEEAYGISDNIWTETTTSLIPRVIWPDKPAASDARRYGALYFENGDTSPALTPFGDLLRNFGVLGVPLGMFVLGFVLRTIHTTLLDYPSPSVLNRTLYFMLLISVSYEGFYGTIIPMLIKGGFVSLLGISLVYVLFKKMWGSRPAVRNA